MTFARVARSRPSDEDRQTHILAAAERAFVAYGFHAATMTQVAEEAGMSAGNLYRYFPSKEAIVEGLCLADQVKRTESFAALAGAEDLGAAMRASLDQHVVRCPREKARMIVEIWAESSRNARVAEFARQLDRDVIGGLIEIVELAKLRGVAAASLDAKFAASVVYSLIAGLFKRKALEPAFDVEAESAMVIGVFEALFKGAMHPRAEV